MSKIDIAYREIGKLRVVQAELEQDIEALSDQNAKYTHVLQQLKVAEENQDRLQNKISELQDKISGLLESLDSKNTKIHRLEREVDNTRAETNMYRDWTERNGVSRKEIEQSWLTPTPQELQDASSRGKIYAIKRYRDRTKAGLAESKEAIERWYRPEQ